MRAWIFLIISGLFEVGWIVSLKMTSGFSRFGPLAGYLIDRFDIRVMLVFGTVGIGGIGQEGEVKVGVAVR